MKLIQAGLLAAGALAVSGCATIVNGPNLDYVVDSEPGEANVVFHGGTTCTTPCEQQMPRDTHSRVDIVKEGYEPVYVLVQSKTGAATVGNVLAGGIIGAVVDANNGSNKFLSPRPLIVRLAPIGSGEEAVLLKKNGDVISTVAEHNNEVRSKVAEHLGTAAAGIDDINAVAEVEAESDAGVE